MRKNIAIGIFVVIALFGCSGNNDKSEGKVLKKVGNEVITEKDLADKLEIMPADYKQYYGTEEGKKKLLDLVAEQKMMKLEALKKKVDTDKEYKKEFESLKENLLAKYLVKKDLVDKIVVTDEEVKKEYDSQKEQFKQPEEVQAGHILITANGKTKEEAKKKAEELLKEALAGKNFKELAKANSEDGSAQNGGDLGWIQKGRTVPEFEKAIFAGETGKVYPKVVETQFGYHIIKINEKKAEGYKTFDEVKDKLKESIKGNKVNEKYSTWLADIKKNYTEKK